MLAQALELARQADVTVIAGDIYDRQVPPAEAVALFDSFLTRMSAQGSPVLFIAGNHDSAERMAFGAQLMNASGVYAAPVYDGRARRVELADEYGPVYVYLLPFVKPVHVRAALDRPDIEGYTAALAAAIGEMGVDPTARNVLVAHQFVTGGERSESEEIAVGGLDNVDAQVLDAFDYVALGHLHAAQSLCGGRVRYSGAPLPYAFSEAGREKGALLVTLGEKGKLDVQPCPFTPLRRMRRLRGAFDALARGEASEDYLQITLTDEDDIPEAAARLSAIYPNLLQLLYDNTRTRAAAVDFSGPALARRDPLALFDELYAKQNGAPMDERRRAYLSGVIERIWEDEA